MKIRTQPFLPAVLCAGAMLAAGSAGLHVPPAQADESPPPAATDNADEAPAAGNRVDGALSGSLYFTDEDGNPRNPTAAELIAAGEAFEKDLARLAGRHQGKPNVRTEPSGAIAATVATSQLVFLTATVNEDGTVTLGHSTMDADGNVTAQPATLPEK